MKASTSTRIPVEEACFCPRTLTSTLWLLAGFTALLKTTLLSCILAEYRSTVVQLWVSIFPQFPPIFDPN